MREYKHRICYVYLFSNGMVAVFDQNDEQMPFFQGRKEEAMPRIKRRLERQKGVVLWHGVKPEKLKTLKIQHHILRIVSKMKWAKVSQLEVLKNMLRNISQANLRVVGRYMAKGWLAKGVTVPLDEPLRFDCNKLVSDLAVLHVEYNAGCFDITVLNERFNELRPRIEQFLDAKTCIPDKIEE